MVARPVRSFRLRAPQLVFGVLIVLCVTGFSAQEVRLATYNVENYLSMPRMGDGTRVESAPKPEPEVQAVVRILSALKPDLLVLTEMGGPLELLDLQDRLAKAGFSLPYSTLVDGADEERKVALLSRWAIKESHSRDDVVFELDGRPQRMSRGILDATVAIPTAGDLRILGLHLKSRRPVPQFDQAQFRQREALAVRHHLDAIFACEAAGPLVLLGDLNDTIQEEPVKTILGVRGGRGALHPVRPVDRRGESWTHFWKVADSYSRIDYIFLSSDLVARIDPDQTGIYDGEDWREASDHRPVFTTLVFP